MWEVILMPEVEDWFLGLDPQPKAAVADAVDALAEGGPTLGRPDVDRINGSKFHNMKELRVRSGTHIRILFIFDPERQAVLLTAGDKTGDWNRWYRKNIPVADKRYRKWLKGER